MAFFSALKTAKKQVTTAYYEYTHKSVVELSIPLAGSGPEQSQNPPDFLVRWLMVGTTGQISNIVREDLLKIKLQEINSMYHDTISTYF
jgi:hypothetical protein